MTTPHRLTQILVAALLMFATNAISQSSKPLIFTADSLQRVQQAQIDSLRLRLAEVQYATQAQYLSTLEKTNQQLSLWFNPYALLVASLAILFTLLAIIATALIYRQSKEYREKLDSFVKSYQEVFDKLITELSKRRDDIEKQIKEHQTQLAKVAGEGKKAIEVEIERLTAKKDSVSSQIASTVAAIPASGSPFGLGMERHHKCSQCGRGFMIKAANPFYFAALGSEETVKCPKCGNIDKL